MLLWLRVGGEASESRQASSCSYGEFWASGCRYYGSWGWDYLSGGGGGPCRCPSLSPGNRPSTPPFWALTHQVTHSPSPGLFLVFVCTHTPDGLVFCFCFLRVVATHFRFTGRESNKLEDRDESLQNFAFHTREEKGRRVLETVQGLQIFLCTPLTPLPPTPLLPLFVKSSVYPLYLLCPPPLTTVVSHYLYRFPW